LTCIYHYVCPPSVYPRAS